MQIGAVVKDDKGKEPVIHAKLKKFKAVAIVHYK